MDTGDVERWERIWDERARMPSAEERERQRERLRRAEDDVRYLREALDRERRLADEELNHQAFMRKFREREDQELQEARRAAGKHRLIIGGQEWEATYSVAVVKYRRVGVVKREFREDGMQETAQLDVVPDTPREFQEALMEFILDQIYTCAYAWTTWIGLRPVWQDPYGQDVIEVVWRGRHYLLVKFSGMSNGFKLLAVGKLVPWRAAD